MIKNLITLALAEVLLGLLKQPKKECRMTNLLQEPHEQESEVQEFHRVPSAAEQQFERLALLMEQNIKEQQLARQEKRQRKFNWRWLVLPIGSLLLGGLTLIILNLDVFVTQALWGYNVSAILGSVLFVISSMCFLYMLLKEKNNEISTK